MPPARGPRADGGGGPEPSVRERSYQHSQHAAPLASNAAHRGAAVTPSPRALSDRTCRPYDLTVSSPSSSDRERLPLTSGLLALSVRCMKVVVACCLREVRQARHAGKVFCAWAWLPPLLRCTAEQSRVAVDLLANGAASVDAKQRLPCVEYAVPHHSPSHRFQEGQALDRERNASAVIWSSS